MLGAADADLLFGAVDAVDAGDARAALLAAARLAESGRDVGRFFGDLEAHLRGLMIVQTLGEVPDELRVTPEQDERLAEQARRVGPASVLRLLDLVADALRAMKDGADPRTQLELALVKGARPEHDPSLRALMARLERLEAGRPAAAPPAAGPPPRGPGDRRRARRPGAGRRRARRPAAAPAEAPAVVAASAEVDGAPPVTAVAVVEPDGAVGEPEVRVGVELDLPGVDRAVARRARRRPGALADAARADARTRARPRSTGGELTLSWAESAAFYKRKAEDPGLPRADRDGDPHASPAARCASPTRSPTTTPTTQAPRRPPLSEDELIDTFMREFDAEELPAEEES